MHEFEPKVLQDKKGQTLAWLCYQGNRVGQQIEPEGIGKLIVTHLEPVVHVASRSFWLTVSTNCLLDDLAAAIDRFISAGPEDERVTAWNRAARELSAPDPFDFTVP
jgi:hypothetical protein